MLHWHWFVPPSWTVDTLIWTICLVMTGRAIELRHTRKQQLERLQAMAKAQQEKKLLCGNSKQLPDTPFWTQPQPKQFSPEWSQQLTKAFGAQAQSPPVAGTAQWVSLLSSYNVTPEQLDQLQAEQRTKMLESVLGTGRHELSGEYERVLDALLAAMKPPVTVVDPGIYPMLAAKRNLVVTYNDNLSSPAKARAWFQRALETTF